MFQVRNVVCAGIMHDIRPGLAEQPLAQPQENAGTDNGDDSARKPPVRPDPQNARQETANEGSDDAYNDVSQQAALRAHDLPGNPADNCAGDQRTQKSEHANHSFLFFVVCENNKIHMRNWRPLFPGNPLNVANNAETQSQRW